MRRTTFGFGVAAAVLLAAGHDGLAQRGGRVGGGAARVGGGAIGGPYGGAGVGARSTGTVVGPAGGTRTAGTASGSYTTQRGTTIDYAGAGRGGTTPGGVSYGRGVGGVQVTTPGGKELTKVGTAGGAVGPGGNAVGGRAGVTTGSGPGGGSFGTAYHGGVAVGPQGVAAAGGRVGTATGPAGNTVSGAARGAVAVGPYGAAAGRTAAAAGAGGTYYRSAAAVTAQGYAVRQNFRTFARQYPVLTARWLGPTYRPVTWAVLAGWAGYGTYVAEPVYYDYGTTVMYLGDTVFANGQSVGTAEQYAQQAVEIAAAGEAAKPDPKQGEWQQLGVFAMVGEGEEKSTNLFQLAVNKAGVIAGEYYNALTDETSPVRGSVDAKTQRAAWTVGDRKFPVYEAGVANLTRDETTMLVHFSKEKAQQFTLVRIPQPGGDAPPGGK
ncbi:MAG: hypothetical protein C0501_17745 [Isosphaera sp.]|nr:hypothetical protein [Isosphaera sp.]